MAASLIGLGANLGNVRETMIAAKRLLSEEFGASHLTCSHLYRTPPIGGPSGQGDFLNAVIRIESRLSAWDIWDVIKRVELQLGRERQLRWEARRIDIDLLLHDQERIWTPRLKVPHPRMCMRSFVLLPAAEIVSDWKDPVTGWTLQRLSEHLNSSVLSNRPIRVLCSTPSQLEVLRLSFSKSQETMRIKVDWGVFNREVETQLVDIAGDAHAQPKLNIVAVQSPDPLAVHWEDHAMPWAKRLNLLADSCAIPEGNHGRACIEGPRYLLPMNDLPWAVHEITAASQAMECYVENCGPFGS